MFLSLGLPGAGIDGCFRAAFRTVFAVICMGFNRFLGLSFLASSFFVAIYMGFKEYLLFLFNNTPFGECDLQKLR